MNARAEQPIRVVVVDDEDDLRALIRRYLERAGRYAVVGEASATSAAVDLVASVEADVILLDLVLGLERGVDAVGPLVRVAPSSMIAVLTGLPAEDQEVVARSAGAFTFYEKSMLAHLARFIADDLALFRRALRGEDVVAPSALARRSS